MQEIIIDGLLKKIEACVQRHNLGKPAEYARSFGCENSDCSINEYGVSDAANILYTLGAFEQPQADRKYWIKVLQKMQNPTTGLYFENTHHTFHTTAHCIAALDLFDAKPLYELKGLEHCLTKNGLYNVLENEIDWAKEPWRDSHIGAGLFASLSITDKVDLEWKNWYFDWLWNNTDPETGFICKGKKEAPLYSYMAGFFHFLFNMESEHRPMRYPDKVIDSCLKILENLKRPFLCHCSFIEIDVVYCLTRAMRQSAHRFEEAKTALEDFAMKFMNMMLSLDYEKDEYFNDLHPLFGSLCCLAELQSALPGKILSSKPLRLVLDRRPFI